MTIKNISVSHIQLPLQTSLLHPEQSPLHSDSIFLHVYTDSGIHTFGESYPDPLLGIQGLQEIKADFERNIPFIKSHSFDSLADIQEFVLEEISSRMKEASICALEMALLYAWANEQNQELPQLFKVVLPKQLPYTGILPLGNLSLITSHLESYSFKKVKLKINRDLAQTLDNIRLLRDLFGEDLSIQVDIAGSWMAEDALEQIPDLLDQGIRVFEQPFDMTQDLRMAKLQRRYRGELEFVADESIVRYKDAVRLIKREACTQFNLKIAKQGGLFNTLKIYELARQYGIQCELGTYIGESSLLRYMGTLFTTKAKELVHIEQGLAGLALAQDISSKTISADHSGNLDIPTDIFAIDNSIHMQDLEKHVAQTPFEASV